MSKLPARLNGLQTREGCVVLVIVTHYWGRGPSLEEAVGKVREAGGGSRLVRGPIRVYQEERKEGDRGEDRQAYVDEYGALCWWGDRPELVFEQR